MNTRFRIAFSFAEEKRDFVAQVAALLAIEFGRKRILYDHYQEAEFARPGIAYYLPELYHNETDLIVAVFCPGFDSKKWIGLEWHSIEDLIKLGRGDRVMLTRFEREEGKGLYDLAGFVELDHLSPADMAALVLEHLALIDQRRDEERVARAAARCRPAATTIPNNLPALQPFFGRESRLALLREALDAATPTWGMLIDGPAGIGKTALALRAAYDCPADQFDRIIFISVADREMDDEHERRLTGFILPGILEMLNELARELGQPDITKAPEDQRIPLLLDALASSRILLVLDNLDSLTKADRFQLFTFVKRLPPHCKALLTSRRRLGAGSEVLILERLGRDAALLTLSHLSPNNKLLARTTDTERAALHTHTDGNPLLLRWVAGQLGRGQCRTFVDAMHFLRSCPPDMDPLEFVFRDLASQFTPDETQILCALTYFTRPATHDHVAELSGLCPEHLKTSLANLIDRCLVVADPNQDGFTLVPIIASFLRKALPEVMQETGRRLEQRAYVLIMENGHRHYDRFPVLEAAWPTVAPALPVFVEGDNRRLQTICDALRHFLNYTGHWDEWVSLNEKAERVAVAALDFFEAGWRAFQAGRFYRLRHKPEAVLACAERASTHWGNTTRVDARTHHVGPREWGNLEVLRGKAHYLKQDHAAAIRCFYAAIQILRAVPPHHNDDPVLFNLAGALNGLADAKRLAGVLDEAEHYCLEALHLARRINYRDGVASYTSNLAALALARKDWAGAEAFARQALPLCEGVGRQELIANTSRRLARALIRQGNASEALPLAQRAVTIFRQLGSVYLKDAVATLRECEAAFAHVIEAAARVTARPVGDTAQPVREPSPVRTREYEKQT